MKDFSLITKTKPNLTELPKPVVVRVKEVKVPKKPKRVPFEQIKQKNSIILNIFLLVFFLLFFGFFVYNCKGNGVFKPMDNTVEPYENSKKQLFHF